jgi:hypothetical protein
MKTYSQAPYTLLCMSGYLFHCISRLNSFYMMSHLAGNPHGPSFSCSSAAVLS